MACSEILRLASAPREGPRSDIRRRRSSFEQPSEQVLRANPLLLHDARKDLFRFSHGTFAFSGERAN